MTRPSSLVSIQSTRCRTWSHHATASLALVDRRGRTRELLDASSAAHQQREGNPDRSHERTRLRRSLPSSRTLEDRAQRTSAKHGRRRTAGSRRASPPRPDPRHRRIPRFRGVGRITGLLRLAEWLPTTGSRPSSPPRPSPQPPAAGAAVLGEFGPKNVENRAGVRAAALYRDHRVAPGTSHHNHVSAYRVLRRHSTSDRRCSRSTRSEERRPQLRRRPLCRFD